MQVHTQPSPAKETNELLIKRIKALLSLPNPESTFVARASILRYVTELHERNEAMR